jgi:protein gp37
MSLKSPIEWTESTWNPLTGCTKISLGCKNCYAERLANRMQKMGQPNYINGFKLTMHEDALTLPLRWKKPQRVFVNSMSDLFHSDVPDEFIISAFDVMRRASQHQFQVLTKRSERLLEISPRLGGATSGVSPWASNIWMGVSVENADYAFRIAHLRASNAHIKFLSLEPLLGPIPNLDLSDMDWVIVGGESGPGARPMNEAWVIDIRSQCQRAGVPFFFKQWGGVQKKKAGRMLEGQTWDELPKTGQLTLAGGFIG